MTDSKFFDDSFIGNKIKFTNSPSRWILQEKLSDKNDQLDMWEFQEFRKPSAAYGTFRATSENGSEIAIIKIIMQIPYHGTEFTSPAERERQATTYTPIYGEEMLAVFETLTHNKCTSSPALVSVNRETQDDDSKMVPGGFMIYLLLEHLPGIKMGPLFWDLNREERDKIRTAFRTGWEECIQSKCRPDGGQDHLFWDAASNKVYFSNFIDKLSETSTDPWTEVEWILFGLAEGPRDPAWNFEIFKAAKGSCDTSTWKM